MRWLFKLQLVVVGERQKYFVHTTYRLNTGVFPIFFYTENTPQDLRDYTI